MEKLYTLKTYTVGTPVSPAHWVSEPVYEDFMEVTITAGGGLGGTLWYEYIPQQKLPANEIISVETMDGVVIQLNTSFIVKAEPVTIMFASYQSENPYYKRGRYRVQWIVPNDYLPDPQIDLVNRYIADSAPDRGKWYA